MTAKITRALSELETGAKGKVVTFRAQGLLKQKLYNMGFIPGSEILVVRSAPLLDPIEVMVQNYFVSIRREEAAIVEVEEI